MSAFQITFNVNEPNKDVSKIKPFSLKRRKKSAAACNNCTRLHRKCEPSNSGTLDCDRCIRLHCECSWAQNKPAAKLDKTCRTTSPHKLSNNVPRDSSMKPCVDSHRVIKCSQDGSSADISSKIFYDEEVYCNLFRKNNINSQFITSTQPLAPIFSRDSFLCFDGDIFGLYNPWTDVHSDRSKTTDEDYELKQYLTRKGAFILPEISEQRKLIQLFLKYCYPLYPVIRRDILSEIDSIPLLLLNSLMLCAVKYDSDLKGRDIRIKIEELRVRCKLLSMIETDEITLIQSYLLQSSHEEGPEGPKLSREYVTKACMLSIQLGLHLLGVKDHFEILNEAKEIECSFRSTYSKSFLRRMFWTSFCCDRVIAATSCTAMFYNRSDLAISELTFEDFEDSAESGINPSEDEPISHRNAADFEIFNRWYSICSLLERVLTTVYRPPEGRSQNDFTLELDLLNWESKNLQNCSLVDGNFENFFRICCSYANILYLRSKVDFLTVVFDHHHIQNLEKKPLDKAKLQPMAIPGIQQSHSPLSDYKMLYIAKISLTLIETIKRPEFKIHHIIVIHSLLHVLVLLHLEIKCRQDILMSSRVANSKEVTEEANTNQQLTLISSLNNKKADYNSCLELLEKFKLRWWFSSAAFALFSSLQSSD